MVYVIKIFKCSNSQKIFNNDQKEIFAENINSTIP
jgi:hypothetical protein